MNIPRFVKGNWFFHTKVFYLSMCIDLFEVIPLNNGRIKGRLLLWTLVLWVFLFLGTVYVCMPEHRESAMASFPLFHRLASKMDAAAEQLTRENGYAGFLHWGDGCAETNLDS